MHTNPSPGAPPEEGSPKIRLWPRNIAFKIFLIALLSRLLAIGFFGEMRQPQLWEYGAIAKNIVAGAGYELSYPSSDAERRAGSPDTLTVPSAYMPPAYPL